MKRNYFKMMFVALAAVATVACSEDEGTTIPEGVETTVASGETMTISTDYTLEGPITVKDGGKLVISAGVTITHTPTQMVSYIMIEQGATIEAIGTADAPIIMTSENKVAGAWGGIHICGKASVNKGEGSSEVGEATYGAVKGSGVDTDDSGTLKYVIVEYAGYLFSSSKEANGFSFYGVGSGTTVEYCVAYKGADDGFEWFGGTVGSKYLVSVGNQDDLFDWTEGWTGENSYWIGDQINNACDQTIEGDNSKSDSSLTPISNPTISYVTLIGDNNGGDTSGILLRNGTQFTISNVVAFGKTTDIKIDDNDSGDSNTSTSALSYFADGSATLENIYFASAASSISGNETGATNINAEYDLSAATYATTIDGAGAGADWLTGTWGDIVKGYLTE